MTHPSHPTPEPALQTLNVALGERSYDIFVGEGLIARSAGLLRPLLPQPRVVIVTDTNVAPLYLEPLRRALEGGGISSDAVVLPAGEPTKDFGHLETLVSRLLDLKVERQTTLIALGGGVIGDITGFAAAITLRGLPFVQIPTTLLAQVDSSVGGKTGINTRHGKNLVGAFYQPLAVIADTDTFDTLPMRQVLAGYGEVVKYGAIDDPDFFSWLERHGADMVAHADPVARRHAVLHSCRAKAAIVAGDERESGARALLNLGHTFAHALESTVGYGDGLLHGEAVAIGIVLAFEVSVKMGLCPDEDIARLRAHFENIGLPHTIKPFVTESWSGARLVELMGQDKKVRDNKITFILARGIGKAFITDEVDLSVVTNILQDAIDRARA
ncbi:3-dehydroquinate synthase [Varunaivibrio sulfuroxidans]|uniref:3-dehydroquinate synthase n=1 Tax=Varunaivibrio sulfuroxidans TaxID=1773489 RepID=A0A4R3JCV7_9PROT|nr:3-dehydroquinate synthase [Varunaivibrio sulfuroxidans]TCS63507.1 3-dehydroquinate synthase [Varunaivibrio sulfuroxidans]WES30348.1 3-dehydroquinate synthase [Varunaivibrio sulfuroxidans]